MSDTRRLEYKLVHDALLLDVDVIESDARPLVGEDDWAVRIQVQTDPRLIDACAHGFLFALAAMSFNEARPRDGASEWVEPSDQFSAADLLEHLRFEQGKLRLQLDELRGRCLKTTIELTSDGRARIETLNRGKSALGWVARLQGKQLL
jgi:hypothetical protein